MVSQDTASASDAPARIQAVVARAALVAVAWAVSCLMTVLYHLGVMQRVVWIVAKRMQKSLRTSGAETLVAASNILLGPMESPLAVQPFMVAGLPAALVPAALARVFV